MAPRFGLGRPTLSGPRTLIGPGVLRLRPRRLLLLLMCIGLVVFSGLQLARHSLRRWRASVDVRASVSTCSGRLAALGVWPDDATLDHTQPNEHTVQRRAVYLRMSDDLGTKGLSLGGVITQGLTQEDLFRFQPAGADALARKLTSGSSSGSTTVLPVLRPLDVPVRALILPLLDRGAAAAISHAVAATLLPELPPGAIWLQDSALYHATVFHASSHTHPVPAGPDEVAEELLRVRDVGRATCPVRAVLERVVLTSGGVLVACWQAASPGGEPMLLRTALASALPHAPPKEKQMVQEPAMLHTTLARLLQPPSAAVLDVQRVVSAVRRLSDDLCGLQAEFSQMWFVEERDLLALALKGHFASHVVPLGSRRMCPVGP